MELRESLDGVESAQTLREEGLTAELVVQREKISALESGLDR